MIIKNLVLYRLHLINTNLEVNRWMQAYLTILYSFLYHVKTLWRGFLRETHHLGLLRLIQFLLVYLTWCNIAKFSKKYWTLPNNKTKQGWPSDCSLVILGPEVVLEKSWSVKSKEERCLHLNLDLYPIFFKQLLPTILNDTLYGLWSLPGTTIGLDSDPYTFQETLQLLPGLRVTPEFCQHFYVTGTEELKGEANHRAMTITKESLYELSAVCIKSARKLTMRHRLCRRL